MVTSPEEILKDLVAQIPLSTDIKPLSATVNLVSEILLQVEIEGTSYYVVRSKPKSSRVIQLSHREVSVVNLVAQGLPNKSIGKRLNISPWTVSTYLRRIFGKLNVNSKAEMIAKLAESGVKFKPTNPE